MANEFTLADYERIAPDNLNKAVARTWREASPIMDMLKFRTSKKLSEKVIRFNAIGAPTWRKIGESFVQMKVNPEPIEERLYFMGGKIDIAREYVKAEALSDIRTDQEKAALTSMAFGFNDAFFTNTPNDDEDGLVGMWYRLKNDLGSAQYFDAGIDVSEDTALTTWAHRTFDVVDHLLSLVDGNPGDKALFMGQTLFRRFQSACRQSSILATTKDQLGRIFTTYGEGGPKIIDVGYSYDQASKILGDVEDGITALTGGAKSSMYAMRFGAPYVEGWCQEMPNAEDKGETEDGVNLRTIVRFSPGLFITNPRSAALAYGWTAA